MKPRFAYLAAIGMFAAALTLAACGRKGPVDPPPSEGAAAPAKRTSAAPGLNPLQSREKSTTPAAFDADGRPVASGRAPKRPLPMDWLID